MAGENTDAVLIAALATGQEVVAAAQQAGVSERTVYRRLADPAFAAELRQARVQARVVMVEHVAGTLTAAGKAAVETLVQNLSAEQAGVQVRAALGLLDQMTKLHASSDLEARLAELEARIAAQEQAAPSHPRPQPPAFPSPSQDAAS